MPMFDTQTKASVDMRSLFHTSAWPAIEIGFSTDDQRQYTVSGRNNHVLNRQLTFTRGHTLNRQQSDFRALMVKQLDGSELFRHDGFSLPHSVADFWRWAYSNLAANNLRGHLAEFLVASDLNVNQNVRVEWDDCDLHTESGIKVEVKSAAYLQTWNQSKHSVISFGVAPSRAYDNKINARKSEAARNSDVYVFCLLAHKDKSTLDPTDLNQWEFYVLPTETLNTKLKNQQTLSVGRLMSLKPGKCRYGEISRTIDEVLNAAKSSSGKLTAPSIGDGNQDFT